MCDKLLENISAVITNYFPFSSCLTPVYLKVDVQHGKKTGGSDASEDCDLQRISGYNLKYKYFKTHTLPF